MKNNNQKFIIRTDRAGVYFAGISERRGDEADLINARRIWSWQGATDCIGIANDGLNPGASKLTVVIPSMTVLGVIEVIPVSDTALPILEGCPEWRA